MSTRLEIMTASDPATHKKRNPVGEEVKDRLEDMPITGIIIGNAGWR